MGHAGIKTELAMVADLWPEEKEEQNTFHKRIKGNLSLARESNAEMTSELLLGFGNKIKTAYRIR